MIDFMKLEAVIWDMDGVMLDSRSAHFKAFRSIFKKHGIKVYQERLQRFFGMTNQQIIQLMVDQPISKELTDQIGREKDILFQMKLKEKLAKLIKVKNFQKNIRKI